MTARPGWWWSIARRLFVFAVACGADRAPSADAAIAACPGSAELLCTHDGVCRLPDGGACDEPHGSGFP